MRSAAVLATPALTLFLSGAASAGSVPAVEHSPEAVAAADLTAADLANNEIAKVAAMEASHEVPAPPDGMSGPRRGQEDEDTDILPGEFLGDVVLISNYIFRGTTNTDHSPAVQGGLSYSVHVGLRDAQPYASFWGSNVDSNDGGGASAGLDLGVGVSGSFGEIGWDIGALCHAYPGTSQDIHYSYWDTFLQLIYGFVDDDYFLLLAQYSYAPDFFASSGNAQYLLAGTRWEQPILSMKFDTEATTGYQWIEDNAAYGTDDYRDWRVALSLTIDDKITSAVAYTDTDLGKSQCFAGTNQCEPRGTVSVGASF